MRLFEHDYVSSSMHYINQLNPDIFISTWSHTGFSYNSKRENIFNKRLDIQTDLYERIFDTYTNIKSLEIEDYDDWLTQLDEKTKSIMTGNLIGGEIITSPPQLYKLYKCNQLKINYESEHNFKYDVVIRIRPDLLFLDNLVLDNLESINNINFGIPGAYWPNRIYDIFFYSNSLNMDILCDVWKNLSECIDDEFDNGLDKKDCCRLLYVWALKNKIPVKNLTTRYCEVYRNETITEFIEKIKRISK